MAPGAGSKAPGGRQEGLALGSLGGRGEKGLSRCRLPSSGHCPGSRRGQRYAFHPVWSGPGKATTAWDQREEIRQQRAQEAGGEEVRVGACDSKSPRGNQLFPAVARVSL